MFEPGDYISERDLFIVPSKRRPLTTKRKIIMICIFWFVTCSTLVAYIRVGVIFVHQIFKNRTGQPMQWVIQPDTFFCYARVFSCVLLTNVVHWHWTLKIMLMWFETVERVIFSILGQRWRGDINAAGLFMKSASSVPRPANMLLCAIELIFVAMRSMLRFRSSDDFT